MKNPLKPTIICLRISSILYFIIGLVSILPFFTVSLADEPPTDAMILRIVWGMMCVLCFGMGVFVEFVIKALKGGKHWGWIAGICLAALYAPSLFLVLGIIMFVNLLKEESQEYCKKRQQDVDPNA